MKRYLTVLQQKKKVIRKKILERRALLNSAILNMAEKSAAEQLASTEDYRASKTIMLYMNFRNEVPTGSIINNIRYSGKKLVLPYTNKEFEIIPYEIPLAGELKDYLVRSRFGVLEPDPSLCKEANVNSIDLVVVPGSVFDITNNRIGYGKGCYDRFLSKLPASVYKIGLAYDFQVLPSVPTTQTDVKMNEILIIETNIMKKKTSHA
ncbi:MAG TPA: 5-formyltetrahydrofolate cyclo-ligase [Clostridiales bacterium]|jgi:5-formyltetrahydrofolate cyclo-ligase|nr:5-formyltetrahydrofolate cyclo-ligase [Clostridiales bacterium]